MEFGQIIAVVVAALVLSLAILWIKRRWLSSRGGAFDCGLQIMNGKPAWMLGMALYEQDCLEWYRAFSLVPRPKIVIRRGSVNLIDRRIPDESEAFLLYDASEILQLNIVEGSKNRVVELAMTTDSVVGLLSWLEAGPRTGVSYPGGE